MITLADHLKLAITHRVDEAIRGMVDGWGAGSAETARVNDEMARLLEDYLAGLPRIGGSRT